MPLCVVTVTERFVASGGTRPAGKGPMRNVRAEPFAGAVTVA